MMNAGCFVMRGGVLCKRAVFYFGFKNKTCKCLRKVPFRISNWGKLLIGQMAIFWENIIDLSLFAKYFTIYHFFEIQVCEIQVYCGIQVPDTRVFLRNNLQICSVVFYGTRVP